MISGKTPDIIGIGAQAQEEVCRLALSRSTAFARSRGERINGITFGEDFGITGAEIHDPSRRQGTANLVHLVAGRNQQVNHATGPGLPQLFEDIGQFAQVMGIAQAVLASEVTIGLPAIVNERTQKARKNGQGIECLPAPLRVTSDPRHTLVAT